jgi:hypothetical protein
MDIANSDFMPLPCNILISSLAINIAAGVERNSGNIVNMEVFEQLLGRRRKTSFG